MPFSNLARNDDNRVLLTIKLTKVCINNHRISVSIYPSIYNVATVVLLSDI